MDLNALAALIQERDELKGHALRLAEEVESAAQTNIALTGRLTVAETQREALQAERDELKGHLARLAAELAEAHAQILAGQPISLFVEPGHFYSPVVDPASPFVTKALAAAEAIGNSGTIPAVDVSDQRMLAEFAKLARWYPEMPFTPEKTDGLRYYFDNPAFSWTDAFVLYGMLRTVQPKRIVEIGCGYSTCVIFDTADRFLTPRPEISCFDPYPDVPHALTQPDDPLRQAIQAIPLQEIPNEVFTSLEPGDILFIDSSHIARTGSDVLDYMFRALPLITPGVFVHIHDIGYPFEYSEEWVVKENRSWNEGYFLRAFLMYNEAFEIVFWNSYFVQKFADRVGQQAPNCLKNGGGSIWLLRR
jgi:hypothetical protein